VQKIRRLFDIRGNVTVSAFRRYHLSGQSDILAAERYSYGGLQPYSGKGAMKHAAD
jgi:hypothetical protein